MVPPEPDVSPPCEEMDDLPHGRVRTRSPRLLRCAMGLEFFDGREISTIKFMESMTGHGRGSALADGWRISVECSSVNRKGIEIAISIPKPLSMLEPKLREIIQKRISRGRINITVSLENATSAEASPSVIDKQAARRVLNELQALQAELALPGEISLELLLRSPGVVRNVGEETPDAEKLWPVVQQSLGEALDRMITMRKKEGAHLVTDMLKRIKLLESAAKAIRTRVPGVLRTRRDHLKTRLEELGLPLPVNDPALARELAFMAERSDITEELTRLESHFTQCRESLNGREPAGRTLDYLAQEMFREFNTLGNKAGDASISQRVVQSKAELDRIREQVANLE